MANVAPFSEGKMYVPVDKDKCAEFANQEGKLFITDKFIVLLLLVDGMSIETDRIIDSNPSGKYEIMMDGS